MFEEVGLATSASAGTGAATIASDGVIESG